MTTNTNTIDTNDSVLKTLRSLMPNRPLTYREALQRAELQAIRLLSLHGVTEPAVPIEIVKELPRIRIEQTYDLPVSGSAHWDGHYWVISVNATEYDLRQRFSIMHEFKHVLDHPFRHLIQGHGKLTADEMAEKVADYFAACVLMPRAWVKTAFFSGTQSVEALAVRFHVSPQAMSICLRQLGLTRSVARCVRSMPTTFRRPTRRSGPTYFRSLQTPEGALA